ncbi:DoxX family protein [Enterobacter sp. RHBSTW-00994]|uniref:DoxX family protein n=1 Tax=Enterobacter sp. RHBSTW-00994 TaxID=2742676 RepID=UPI0015EA54FA|nr:DoxX family protein [Enterobacter sp. RHBSTW-00994]QLR43333.1 DoxX family protein [Enterobacter sp. RHBSTW-00994]
MQERTVMLIARIIMTPLFIYSGFSKIFNLTDNALKTPFGDTLPGEMMIVVAIIIEIGGSLALIMGYKMKAVSLLLIFYVLLTSIMFHPFWFYTGTQRTGQIIQFTKNLSICAGLIYFWVFQSGAEKSPPSAES